MRLSSILLICLALITTGCSTVEYVTVDLPLPDKTPLMPLKETDFIVTESATDWEICITQETFKKLLIREHILKADRDMYYDIIQENNQ